MVGVPLGSVCWSSTSGKESFCRALWVDSGNSDRANFMH